MVIWRCCDGLSTLCAGFALTIGHQLAYGVSLITGTIQLLVLSTLQEVSVGDEHNGQFLGKRLLDCFRESLGFLWQVKPALGLMFCNSLVGAVDTLLVFFLQAKLPERGIPAGLLGLALLFIQMGGIAGSKLILKLPKVSYRWIFTGALTLVAAGFLAEHSPLYWVMALGGFLSAVGDDALQVRTNAILQDMFPSDRRATLTSVESFTFSVIMIVLSPLAGYVFTCW
jgi:hypothetical protein